MISSKVCLEKKTGNAKYALPQTIIAKNSHNMTSLGLGTSCSLNSLNLILNCGRDLWNINSNWNCEPEIRYACLAYAQS